MAILEFLKEHSFASQEDIAEAVGKSLRTTQAAIRSLKGKGLLSRKGSRKNGRWVVKRTE
ncbi:MAG: winged helix-turn-helix transcriptional regulator [Syntrophomonadaceae bacterium]|nr:winged helix-turn-helix transcriptional regulator [Syntrophomonadaceae bacterium]